MKHDYTYYSEWGKYAYPFGSEAALPEEIKEKYDGVDLTDERFSTCGIPILKEANRVYVNGLTENTVIYGETGCKKTRSIILPLIAMTAGAGESAIVTDVKGELSSNRKLRGFLDEKGVRCIYIDFRSFDKDSYSILEHPFELYKSGKKTKAMSEVSRLMASLATDYTHDSEAIWHTQAESFLTALVELIFIAAIEGDCPEAVNMLSLTAFANMDSVTKLIDIVGKHPDFVNSLMTFENLGKLNNIIRNPAEKMIGSIMGFVYSMINPFAAEPALSSMLSNSSFDINEVYEKPTCIFLIIPDETVAYDMVSGLLTDTFYSRLIETYGKKYMGRQEPKCRVNFICDEFCNLHINDMKSKISASRSRCMRWYLVCQSKAQLEATYKDEASTIIGNCRNMLFLQSCDIDLVNYFCDLCGDTYISDSGPSRLIRPDVLRSLRKERDFKEALFIEGTTVFFAELPDIDSYEFLKKYEDYKPRARRRRRGKVANDEILTPDSLNYIMDKWTCKNALCYDDEECEDYDEDEYDEDELYIDPYEYGFTEEDMDPLGLDRNTDDE